MDLYQAIKAHGEWRWKFRMAIGKGDRLDTHSISSDDRCPLGQWLHSEGKRHYANLPAYTECLHQHAVFHREAAKVAQTINAQRYDDAELMLLPGTPYSNSSVAIGTAIIHLRNALRWD
ncbi:CZB domain-containing protein [Chitiniphilus eburneus]|uniref:Chemotaxis protein n=1 Tax=Chitiniphilus eburneus TaxID=2571148 RepID=A0A4U0PWV9_9NEIS|nr:CZB domain-containing protein [Chitiniphilus eburneus]TJZ73007.1 chemotaxis protein [Chitiniphilus eburneus]